MCACCTVGTDVFPLDAGLLARGQYSEVHATGHLDTGFSWFPPVFKQMLQVSTLCFSCSRPDVNLVANQFHVFYVLNNHFHGVITQLPLISIIIIIIRLLSQAFPSRLFP
jgi:hypothetical protein